MKFRWWMGAGGAVLLLIAAVALRPTKPIAVEIAIVSRGPVEERVSSAASGDVEPKARAMIRAETVGRVLAVKQKAGDRVEAGALLLKLDDRSLAAAAAAARVQSDTATRDLASAESLQKKGALTDQQLLQARSAADLAKANLELAESNLARATVKAPFAGLVSRLPVQEGDSVVIGETLAEVVDDTQLYVRAAFDEVDAARIHIGLESVVRLDAWPDDPLIAAVDRVDPIVGGDSWPGSIPTGADAGTAAALAGKKERTVGVRVSVDPKAGLPNGARPMVGMSADVEVVIARRDGVLRVPSAAVFHEKGRQFVWLFDGAALHRREIETGNSNWEFQEVKSGLAENDRVVVSLDAEGLKDAAKATPKPASSPAPASNTVAR